MPELTRRRYSERQDCRRVYFGDVHIGTIARRRGESSQPGVLARSPIPRRRSCQVSRAEPGDW